MNYIELIKKRGYVSSFKSKEILSEDESKIEEIIKEASGIYNDDININYLKNGPEVYKKVLEFNDKYGKIIEAPQYLAFVTKDVKKGYEKTGYIGEWIISRLIQIGIDGAWLRITDHDECLYRKFEFEEGGYLVTLIGIGYGQKENNIAKLIKNKYKNSIKMLTNMGYSDNLDLKLDSDVIYQLNIREFVYDGKFDRKFKQSSLKNSGLQRVFQELHFAPTITYKQLWRILVSDGKLFVLLINSDKISKIETGIMRFYLEEALKNNGINTKWHDISEVSGVEKYEFPDECFVSGYFTY